MRWTRQGHEFDEFWEKIKKLYMFKRDVYIWGAGERGKLYTKILMNQCNIKGVLDSDTNKHGQLCAGIPIITLKQYLQSKKEDSLIIVCVKKEYQLEILQLLKNIGGHTDDNCMTIDAFEQLFGIALFYEKNLIYLPMVQVSLTERCTLKCKKCAHGCGYVQAGNNKEVASDEVKKSIDLFFLHVNYVGEFALLGGEPFLYEKLPDIVDYVGSRYSQSIGMLSVTTNCTIMPGDDVWAAVKKNNVVLRLSDYSATLKYVKDKIIALRDKADNCGIRCRISKETGWTDYGFDYVNRGGNPSELETVFNNCLTNCHEIRRNRFYFCIMARTVAENMGKDVGYDDYFDMESITDEVNRKLFFEYAMGFSQKGYLDMCNYCHGNDRLKYPLKAAEQL